MVLPVEEVISGQYLTHVDTIVSGSAQASVSLVPTNFGDRAGTMSDLYRLFRFVELEVEFIGVPLGAVSTNEGCIVAFTSGIVNAAPTLAADVIQFPQVAVCMPGCTVPSRLRLARGHLAGIVPWYETQGGAAEPLLDTQGALYVTMFANGTGLAVASDTVLHTRFKIEFADRLPAAMTLQRVVRAESAKRCGTQRGDADVSEGDEKGLPTIASLSVEDPDSDGSFAVMERPRKEARVPRAGRRPGSRAAPPALPPGAGGPP